MAGQQRDQVRLEARTAEAERARADAAAAQAQTADAQRQAATAQQNGRSGRSRSARRRSQGRRQLEAMMADLQAKKTERGMIITIGDVLFATNQATLTPAGMATVRKLAEVLVQNPERTVLVEGFTDSTGGAAPQPGPVRAPRQFGARRTAGHGRRRASASPCAAMAKPIRSRRTIPPATSS